MTRRQPDSASTPARIRFPFPDRPGVGQTGTRLFILFWLAAAAFSLAITPAPRLREIPLSDPIPVLAYYYIWFDTRSWDRAKTDYPLLGRYSSDDRGVMLQHIRWAKEAGIDGFIVSWKSTEKLDRRLRLLVELSAQENFKLLIIYEGLDFYRDPLPITKIAEDLDLFIEEYKNNAVFGMYEKPVVIWSGTWKFSLPEIESVTGSRRDDILILASEKNVDGYERLANLVDGNAYYWSSVNPDTHPGHAEKLISMGEAIHQDRGLWIAPAAPGYDSRLLGGTTVVERYEGETLRKEMSAALKSAPDAIGLISWNEFSENSHIEPSVKFGNLYLKVLSSIERAPAPIVADFDSSAPGNLQWAGGFSRIIALGTLGTLITVSLLVVVRRSYRADYKDSTT